LELVLARENEAFSGVASMAPFFRASSMWDWIFCLAGAEMTGPVVVVWSWGSPSLYLELLLAGAQLDGAEKEGC
jgi:hypothetical protein